MNCSPTTRRSFTRRIAGRNRSGTAKASRHKRARLTRISVVYEQSETDLGYLRGPSLPFQLHPTVLHARPHSQALHNQAETAGFSSGSQAPRLNPQTMRFWESGRLFSVQGRSATCMSPRSQDRYRPKPAQNHGYSSSCIR